MAPTENGSMYCKECGHRTQESRNACPRCGSRLKSNADYGASAKPRVRWQTLALGAAAAILMSVVVPRVFFLSELESIGPTEKLRFLRALKNSQYRRVGQGDFFVEGETLTVMWDLRWQALPENKQKDIVRIIGRAWHVVGGDTTQVRIEGDETLVAVYRDGAPHLETALQASR
jgi:hypothetical protein